MKDNKKAIALSVVASVGVVLTTLSAIDATIKVMNKINEDTNKGNKSDVKEALKFYIPTVSFGLLTVSCIAGSAIVNRQAQASIISACSIIRNQYDNYKDKVIERHGYEEHMKIMQELGVEKAKKVPIEIETLISRSTLGFDLIDDEERIFYDALGGRYFLSTIPRVLEAEYHMNRNFTLGWVPSLNDFYDFLGLEKTDYGETVGWTNSNGDYYWIDFFHYETISDEGVAFYVLDCYQIPTPEFLEDR